MDKNEKNKSDLLSITENYKLEFSSKFKKNNSLIITMKNRYSLIAELQKKLTDELIDVSNKYFEDNGIKDTSEINKFIETCYLDLFEFAKTKD